MQRHAEDAENCWEKWDGMSGRNNNEGEEVVDV